MNIIKISRPRFWTYTAGPFLVGAVFATSALYPQPLWKFLLGLLFFLIPANIYLYGINDWSDWDTDQHNKAKKGRKEELLKKSERKKLLFVILANIALSIPIFFLSSFPANWFLIGYITLATMYSAPPRFKARPIWDFSSNILYVMPGFFAYTWFGGSLPDFNIVLATFFWTAAMHLYSAIPDIKADKKAGVITTAVAYGPRISLWLCGIFWSMFTIIISTYLFPFGLLGLIYVGMVILTSLNLKKINTFYWYFPYINAAIGFVAFLLGTLVY